MNARAANEGMDELAALPNALSFDKVYQIILKFLPKQKLHLELLLPKTIPEYDHLIPVGDGEEYDEIVFKDIPILCTNCLSYFSEDGSLQCNCEMSC